MTDLYKGATCKSCHAEIIWCFTEKGKRQPIDAHPQPGANVRLIDEQPAPRALVVGPAVSLFDPTDDGTRYFAHHMTCPNADEWKRGGEPRANTPGPKRWRTMHR